MKNMRLILLLVSVLAFGQKHKPAQIDIKREIVGVKKLLDQYTKLSPFSEDDNQFDEITSIHDKIIVRLLKIHGDNRIVKYPIETLLKHDELIVAKSEDGKLYFLSLDQKSGGTFREHSTLVHYRLPDGSVGAVLFHAESPDSKPLGSLVYDEIFLLDAQSQKYLAIGGVQTCATCLAKAALIVTLGDNGVQTELLEMFDGRYGDIIDFEYDQKGQNFNYQYNAADNDDSLYGGNNDVDGYKHRYKIRYQYLKDRFVLLERSEFWDKKDAP